MNLAEAQIPAPGRATANIVEGAQSKPEPPNQHRPPESSPYLAARREWDERYGSFITRAKNWRTAAFVNIFVPIFGPIRRIFSQRSSNRGAGPPSWLASSSLRP
jgi:hypothetical protein